MSAPTDPALTTSRTSRPTPSLHRSRQEPLSPARLRDVRSLLRTASRHAALEMSPPRVTLGRGFDPARPRAARPFAPTSPLPASTGVTATFVARSSVTRRSHAACDRASRRESVFDQRCVRLTAATDTVRTVHPSSLGNRLPAPPPSQAEGAPTSSRRRTHRCVARFTTPHTLRALSRTCRSDRRALSSRAPWCASPSDASVTGLSPPPPRFAHVEESVWGPAEITFARTPREEARARVTRGVFRRIDHRARSPFEKVPAMRLRSRGLAAAIRAPTRPFASRV